MTHYVLLSGGIGGAKLALGLSRILPASALTIVANTGDDFEHLGLSISPDLDTLIYTLAGEVNTETGWGRKDETWACMTALEAMGGETWFRLGDRDLATHLNRTQRLAEGQPLSEVTQAFCDQLGVGVNLLPMSDQAVRTRITTATETLEFQEYFVRERALPIVQSLEYEGAAAARPAPGVLQALTDPGLAGIVIAPSNPYLSIDPILAIPQIRQALQQSRVPRLAVSPIVAGTALKGPTAKIMAELGQEPSVRSIARHYGPLIDTLIIDNADAGLADQIRSQDLDVRVCNTIMKSERDKMELARSVVAACEAPA